MRAVRRDHRQHVVVPALDLDRRQRAAAGAGLGLDDDAVAEVVADDRLHAVGEVGEQHRVRRLARRRRTIVAVDRLEQHPVGVDVQPALAATERDAHAFRRAVLVDDAGSRRRARSPRARRRQAFAARPQARRIDRAAVRPSALRPAAPASSDSWRGTPADSRSARATSCGSGSRIEKPRAAIHGLLLARTLPRRDAGEVIAGRGDQGRATAARRRSATECAAAKRAGIEVHGHQRVEGRERVAVLHVDARFARAARALPDDVAAEVALADVRRDPRGTPRRRPARLPGRSPSRRSAPSARAWSRPAMRPARAARAGSAR